MTSYFSEPHHIELFSMGFDLIRDQLTDLMIADIITEIEENLEEYPDDRSSVLALDALYDAIDERDDAIAMDAGYRAFTDSSVFCLREARHLEMIGEREEAERLLDEVIQLDSEDSPVRQLCTLIAYGRRNDRKTFTTTWNRLTKDPGNGGKIFDKDIESLQEECSILRDLPFREHIEGIGFLFMFGISERRDVEIVALVSSFRNYIDNITGYMIEEAVVDGFTDSLPSFSVISAISSGMVKAAEEILGKIDPITDAIVSEVVQPDLDEIRKTGKEMTVIETLKRWSFNPEKPVPELISTLRTQSGGDDELILDVLDLLSSDRPKGVYDEIRSKIPVSGRYKREELEEELYRMMDESSYCDALAFAVQNALLSPGTPEFENLELDALLESGSKEKAFEYLSGRIKTGHLRKRYTDLFELAFLLDRLDELLVIRPVLESGKVTPGAYLLDAYDRLMRKDVKGGLARVEQARRLGLPEDDSLLFSARFLLVSGFPKRVEGICQKMFRRNIPDGKVYPLLIRAYRDMGRVDDACAAEELYRQLVNAGSGDRVSRI